MTRGRKPRLPIETLRSRWWFLAVAAAASRKTACGTLTPYSLAKTFREEGVWKTVESRQWDYYRSGKRSPSESVLKPVERYLPGTKRIFEHGPDFSYLWEALSGEPQTALNLIESEWRNGVRVAHMVHLPESRRFNDRGEWETLPERDGIQDLVVPRGLAERWKVKSGERLNLADKLQHWERLQDVCGTEIDPNESAQFRCHIAGVLLNSAPPATSTKDERSKSHSEIHLPYYAGLSHSIAKARLSGDRQITLPEWDGFRILLGDWHAGGEQPEHLQKAFADWTKLWRDLEELSGLVITPHIHGVLAIR